MTNNGNYRFGHDWNAAQNENFGVINFRTGNVKLKLNEAYYAMQNQTQQHETTLYNMEGSGKNGGFVMDKEHTALELLRSKALADGQRFVFPYVSTGRMNKEQLGDWLTAFNSWLEYTGETIKEERDYRRHFAAWFKHRNPQKENPKLYNPVPPRILPLPVSQPKQDEEIPLTTKEAYTLPVDTRGKFSKGDNKYDMYWLKSLRDEVRSIGG